MLAWALVGLGGALGSMGRYGCSHIVTLYMGKQFPYGTLFVNVLGCLLIGFLAVALESVLKDRALEYKLLVSVGFLGGFTTFSTFSLDAFRLIERGQIGLAALYVGASVLIGVGGLWAGLALVRSLS